MLQTQKELLVTLRREGGGALVLSIPFKMREALSLKAGDFVVLKAENGALVARKVELRRVIEEAAAGAGAHGGGAGEGT